MAKLASIEKILEIKDIPGADKIQAARVLGYWTVIKKGEFQVGDLCCWHSPDCIVNKDNPAYSFLKDKRLRVCRFKGQVSQGLALPIGTVMNGLVSASGGESWVASSNFFTEGLDVSEIVGIVKYEKPVPAQLAGKVEGVFPSFLKKTDELNIRSYPEALPEFNGLYCILTKKYDGSSGTFFIKDGVFGVCSRNLQLKEDESNTFWKTARKYKIEEALRKWQEKYKDAGDICLQGECVGPGINGGHTGASELEFRAFNLFSIKHFKYANHDLFMEFCVDYDIPFVDIVWAGKFNLTLEDLIKMSNESRYDNGELCEGLVLRPVEEKQSEILGGRLSVKIISEEYCIRNKE